MDEVNQPVTPPQAQDQMHSSFENSHNSKVIPFIIVAVLLTLVGAGSYVLGTKKSQSAVENKVASQPSPTISPTPTPDPTADWKVYTDTKGEYTLKYPDIWYTNDCGSPQFDVKQFNDCGSSRTYPITVRDYGNKTVDQIIEEQEGNYDVTEKNIKISGTTYKQLEVTLKTDASAAPWPYREAILTLFPYNNKTYAVIFAKEENLDYLDIYNQMLSTFQFSP